MLRALLLAALLLPSLAHAAPLFTDSFDSGAISETWGEALQVDADHYTPTTAETTFVGTPTKAGAKALHYYYLSGNTEQSPLTVRMGSTALQSLFGGSLPTEIYIEWHEYFTGATCWPSSSQKLLRLGYDDEGVHPESRKEYGFLVQSTNEDVNIQYFCGAWGDSSACNVDGSVHSDDPHPLDAWVKWGYWAKLNTPGSADGFIKVYKNDVLYLNTGNVSIRGTDTRGFNYFWIGGNASDPGGTVSCNGHRYIDEVALYATDPAAEPTPTPTPTPASSGTGYKNHQTKILNRKHRR